jgi:BRCA1/BRCA2-containing complex subunit 3
LLRSDKRKDRVEIPPEQLVAAKEHADRNQTRVIGWYHSHPNITILPSQLDLKTQLTWQQMEQGFVGLIFSCFHKEPNKVTLIRYL